MGTLDDAIREHLELKRRLGASDDELKQKETEAFGAGGPRTTAPAAEPAGAEQAADQAPDLQVEEATPPEDRAEARPDRWTPADDDLLDADEVLPEDSLELDEPRFDQVAELDSPAAEEPDRDKTDDDGPEFLDRTPEQDQLWFDKNPPKDFDFGE